MIQVNGKFALRAITTEQCSSKNVPSTKAIASDLQKLLPIFINEKIQRTQKCRPSGGELNRVFTGKRTMYEKAQSF